VVVDLQKQVQYEAHRLTDPERIYFDLHDTSLAPGLVRDFEVGDALLVRIRIAQPAPGITRVVLETKDSPNFSVSLETNPYRLMVEVRSISAKPKSSRKIDLFAPSKPAPLEHYAMNRGARRTSAWQEPPATPSAAENTVAGMPKFRIVLDAGHGGWDMGTVGRSGLLEKDLVLDVVARLGKLVSKHLGAEVIYTRHDDSYISLERRTEVANLAQADLFVSIHANYSDLPTARGVETYYTKTYSSLHARSQGPDDPQAVNVDWSSVNIREKVQESRQLASDVQQALYHGLAAKNPLVRNRGVKEASYAVLTGTTMPAVLAEVSFVSSPTDETKLQNAAYREEIAEALFKGISAYAEKIHHVNMASARVGAGQ
jgi:N-acetylmuramoyl-L-alanine amidase